MKKMFNVVQGQKRRNDPEKSDWVKLGIAFEDSKGMRIKLNALPIPNEEAEIWLSLFPFEALTVRLRTGMDDKFKGSDQPAQDNDLDDEIPI